MTYDKPMCAVWTIRPQFLPRDAIHSADYAVARCQSVCSSVCPSYAGILSKRLNISSTFFPPTGSHAILVFPHQTEPNWMAILRRGPMTGASNARRYEKSLFFLISHFISEMMQDIAIVTMEGEYIETVPKLLSGAISNDLERTQTKIS